MGSQTPTNVPRSRRARKASNKRCGCVWKVLQNRPRCWRRSSKTSGNYCHGLTIDQSVTKTFLTFPRMRWVPLRSLSLFSISSDEGPGRQAHVRKGSGREEWVRRGNYVHVVSSTQYLIIVSFLNIAPYIHLVMNAVILLEARYARTNLETRMR